jgi:pyridoxine 5-phosphate synthase
MSAYGTTKLSVNLNKVALLRNQRDVGYPDPVAAGRTILKAGAHGLTVHPRPDERHIRKSDVHAIAEMLEAGGWKRRGIEFNIEGNPFEDYMDLVAAVRPEQATLVPDSPEAATSDNGWDVFAEADRLADRIAALHDAGARVSLFMNAEEDAAKADDVMAKAAELGADRVELYTGPYAHAFESLKRDAVLGTYVRTAEAAVKAGLLVNAGHDLTTENVAPLMNALPRLDEVSIGHAFTSDALWMGFEGAVRAYLDALGARPATSKRVA